MKTIRILLMTLFSLVVLNVCSSQYLELSLSQSFGQAKRTGKPLLVIRIDKELIDYSLRTGERNDDFMVDSIIRNSKNIEFIETEYVVHKMNTRNMSHEEIDFENQFLLDYTPNFILFSSAGDLIRFYNPIDFENSNADIIKAIKDTIQSNTISMGRRLYLQEKFEKKSIEKHHLYELIMLRNSVRLRSSAEINKFIELGGEADFDMKEIILNNTFSLSDPTSNYVQNMVDEGNDILPYFQAQFFYNLCEKAKENMDSIAFKESSKLKAKFEYKVLENYNNFVSGSVFQQIELSDYSLSKSNLEEQFYFYKSLSDTVNIIKYGNELASLLIDGYQTNKTDYLNQEIELGDYFLQTIPQLDEHLDSSIQEGLKNLSGNKDERIKMLGVSYDEDISGEINEIAWFFYKKMA